MSNESYPQTNPHPPAQDVGGDCTNEPTSPSTPSAEAPGADVAAKFHILPDISLTADADTVGLKTALDASVSENPSEDSSGGIDIDLSVATPDTGLLGGGDCNDEGEGGNPLISLDSETDAVINIPLFGEHGALGGGSHDVGSLLAAAMVDVGGDGSLGAIIGSDAYDGNVPLAGDLSSALGSTLDLLTTTSSLFDVPALDILGCDGLDS